MQVPPPHVPPPQITASLGSDLARKPIAFLTMECLDGFVAYDHLAIPPLAKLGWEVVDVPWTRQDVDWNRFEAVVIRTPWDYHLRIGDFLEVIHSIERSTAKLINPAEVVRWNLDKSYLRELQRAGLPIVPTHWVNDLQWEDIEKAFDRFMVDEIVLKPTIGAGARDTFRIKRGQQLNVDVQELYRTRTAMLQPFLTSVVELGEWSLFYFGEKYSHTVLKTPANGDFRVQEEYGSHLQSVEASDIQLRIAGDSLRATIAPTIYARVDLVQLPNGTPAIIELELIEPSLYFPYDSASPTRFAEALDTCLRPVPGRTRTERPRSGLGESEVSGKHTFRLL